MTLTPESGQHPLQPLDIITQAVCLAVSTSCVALRLYTKLRITRSPGWEDFTCVLAWLGLIAYAIVTFEADKHGNGYHQWEVNATDLREFSKLANLSQIIYGPIICVTKLSILLLYLRVFAPSRKSKTYFFIQVLIWVNLLFYTANTIVKIFECNPRSKIWNRDTPGHCVNINSLIMTAAVFNVVSDVLILLLPIACVWRLQMTLSKKLGTSAVFAAGAFGCVSSIMRLVASVSHKSMHDKTFDWFPEFLWTTAEITSGIVASCLPAVPSVLRLFFQKTKTMLSERGSRNSTPKALDVSAYYTRQTKQSNDSDTELYPCVNRPWEQDRRDNERGLRDVFQTFCYARSKSRAEDDREKVLEAGDIAEGGSGPSQGILKIVEVDIESAPGRHDEKM
ncbi:hypothetical protein BDV59DRAFT_209293 [Aspergillus ambiguus]|uniref:uncharacterized protein n=1 Tax=Aspergillus ambiguus TaxID=176160 RepID=UPI003CCD71D0